MVARGRFQAIVAIGLAVALSLLGCGGSPTGPSGLEDFPVVSGAGSTCGDASAIYMVIGLSSRVVNPSAAPPLEARMQVGETAKVSIQFVGCGGATDQVWISTNPTVGVLEPIRFGDPHGFNDAFLHALAPGELSVFAEFRAHDQRRHRTTTAYCEGDAQYPGLPNLAGGCRNPRKIGIVRVVL